MLVVGELINASRKVMGAAIEARDTVFIKKTACDQHQAGADYIDVNAGIFVKQEVEYLTWLVTTVQDTVDASCCIDSPDPKAIEAALSVHKGVAMINSISLEQARYDAMLPLVAGTDLKVVARGLDSLIVNPLDKRMMANLTAAETLAGHDEFCANFLQAYREKKFEL